ncbi:MAG: hypothetical protein BWY09_03171 [Candidatus Hydrogenedentes bacterium ADurb.Bin179]|nr:MAG: hypothetical protein BWY09_03171 [Candidatus Hydrogenedentes bacterium ADurb.Bin179]
MKLKSARDTAMTGPVNIQSSNQESIPARSRGRAITKNTSKAEANPSACNCTRTDLSSGPANNRGRHNANARAMAIHKARNWASSRAAAILKSVTGR